MRRPANHSTHVETGRRMRRPYEALSPALSAGGVPTPRHPLPTRRYQSSLFLRRGDACVALQTTARMSKRGDACVAPTKLCHPPYLRAGFQPPAIHFQPAAIKVPSYFVGATHASPCKPQHACRNGATHASPLRSFVTGPICGRGSNPPPSTSNPPLSKFPLTS